MGKENKTEQEFWQNVQELYISSMRVKKLYNSYVNRMDAFVFDYISRHGLWENPAAVGTMMRCLPKLYYPQLEKRSREVFHCELWELEAYACQGNYTMDRELQKRLYKIFPVLVARKEKVGDAADAMWEYVWRYIEEKDWSRNEEALQEIISRLPKCYAKFRVIDVFQTARKNNRMNAEKTDTKRGETEKRLN